jgi:hypothetical protein
MRLFRAVTVLLILSTFLSAACGKAAVEPSSSSSAGALTANTALGNSAPKRFARHGLNSGGAGYLNEFVKPEVRARLDEEPTGDADGGYDPGAASDTGSSSEQSEPEPGGEGQNAEPENQNVPSEDSPTGTARLDTLKYSWATKAFGDAVKASPTTTGVIVLYANENHYDIERLMSFVEGGRNRIAEMSGIGGERIQVVFGGYRSMPQVELWVVPQGSPMPEFKADDRSKPSDPED